MGSFMALVSTAEDLSYLGLNNKYQKQMKIVFSLILFFYIGNSFAKEIELYFIEEPIEYQKICPMKYAENKYFCIGNTCHQNIFLLLNKLNFNAEQSFKFIIQNWKICIPKKPKPKNFKEEIFYINEVANEFFEKNLYSQKEAEEALNYLKRRGIDDGNIAEYGIGWGINNYYALINHLKYLGYDEDLIIKSGLAIARYNDTFDFIKNRITFPVRDGEGHIIGYTARQLMDRRPKYINSTKTKVHDVKKVLFNYYNALPAIKKTKSVIVFEGDFDSLISYFNGITNTVSLMGIEMSDYQIKMLFRDANTIYLTLDNDAPGRGAMEKIGAKILSHLKKKRTLRFVILPKNTDADQVILKDGVEAFYKLVENSLSIEEYFWNVKSSKYLKRDHTKLTFKEKFRLRFELWWLSTKIKDVKTKIRFVDYYNKKLSELE